MPETFSQSLIDQLWPMIQYNLEYQLIPMPGATLTMSGNEITDAIRVADNSWPITQNVGSTDGLTPPAGLGVWRTATNLNGHGQCDAVASYGPGDAGTVPTIDISTPAPFSPQSIKVTTDGTTAAQHLGIGNVSALSAPAGNIGLASIYIKGIAGRSYFVQNYWNNSDATLTGGTQYTFNATGQWQLVTCPNVTVATGKTGTGLIFLVGVNGTRAETFWVAHPMLEQGTYGDITPYIATSGNATSTRLAARVQAPVSLLNTTQGWFAARIKWGFASANSPSTSGAYVFQLSDNTFGNRVCGFFASGSVQTGNVVGSNAEIVTLPATFAQGDFATVIFSWTPTTIGVSLNGSSFTTVSRTKGIPVNMTTLDIGNALSGVQVDSSVFWYACGTGTLTGDDARAFYGYGNSLPAMYSDASQVTSASSFNDTNVYEPTWTNDLTTYLTGLGDELFQEVQDWASDTDDGKPGYSVLLDATRVPDEAIAYLAQFVGVMITKGMSYANQRTQLVGLANWKRGTVAAIQAAPVPFLTGSQTVIVKERFNSDPYQLEVMTYANETVDQNKALAALISQKPAGLVLTYVVFSGQKAYTMRQSALRGTPPDTLRLVV